MMDSEDPRVKDLQTLAWSLQSLTNKPGSRIPETFKRDCYRLASRAISVCSDVQYTEEADFVERSKKFFAEIEAKKKEVGEVEEAEKQKIMGKCYRAAPGGGYEIGKIADKSAASRAVTDSAPAQAALSSSAGGARSLTAAEVTSRLSEDPEVLYLCDLGLGDGDVETLCQGLQRAGASLTSLDVSHNHLADVGVQRLVSALAAGACPQLKELHIGFNSFGELGSQMLKGGLAALRKNLVVHLDDAGPKPAAVALSAAPGAARAVAECCAADAETPVPPQELAQELAPLPPGNGAPVASDSTSFSNDNTFSNNTPFNTTKVSPFLSPVAKADCAGSAKEQSSGPDVLSSPAAALPGAEAMRVDLVKGSNGEGLKVIAVLSLPDGVASAADLDVDVSTWRIVARSTTGALVADAPLPCAVISDTAQAAFSRKRRTMTVTLQPADPVAASVAAQGA